MVGTALRNSIEGRAFAGKLLLLLYLHGGTWYPQRITYEGVWVFPTEGYFNPAYSFWVWCVHLQIFFVRKNEQTLWRVTICTGSGCWLYQPPVMPAGPWSPTLGRCQVLLWVCHFPWFFKGYVWCQHYVFPGLPTWFHRVFEKQSPRGNPWLSWHLG